MRLMKALAGTAAATLLLTACTAGGSGGTSGGGGSTQTLTIANVAGQTWTCAFNPYNPSVNLLSFGFTYEPLVYVNALKNNAETPMLAKSYTWNADKTVLTFTIRDGVKWSDGQPMTADDVAFTFNLLKANQGLDIDALWSSALKSVTASGSTVTATFNKPASTYFYYVAAHTPIVPKHIWSTGDAAKDPVKFQDANPVGTGPYTVKQCSANNIAYAANPTYWQPGLPKVKKINYPAYTDNSPANLDLASGKAQYGAQFIPGVDKAYVSRDPANHHYWFPPTTNVAIYFNLKHPVPGNLAIRQALAYGIDRNQVSKIGESGYQPPANQAGVVTPTFESALDKTLLQKYDYSVDKTKAAQLLAGAGYSPSHPLKLSVITISGYTDWDASLAEIKQQLAPLGVQLSIDDLAGETFNDRLQKGNFDLAYWSPIGGAGAYYEFRQDLHSANSAPIGQNAASNYERYSNPAVDKALDDFASADAATQQKLLSTVEEAMLRDVPIIPTTESVQWYEYDTKYFTGWPTAQDPYALPAPWQFPDVEQVLLHLAPKK
jgi:peptide/nickel transport system substrate-binding protein